MCNQEFFILYTTNCNLFSSRTNDTFKWCVWVCVCVCLLDFKMLSFVPAYSCVSRLSSSSSSWTAADACRQVDAKISVTTIYNKIHTQWRNSNLKFEMKSKLKASDESSKKKNKKGGSERKKKTDNKFKRRTKTNQTETSNLLEMNHHYRYMLVVVVVVARWYHYTMLAFHVKRYGPN